MWHRKAQFFGLMACAASHLFDITAIDVWSRVCNPKPISLRRRSMKPALMLLLSLTLVSCGSRSPATLDQQDGGGGDLLAKTDLLEPDSGGNTCTPTTAPTGPKPHQKVTFVFSGQSNAKAWVVTQGSFCSHLAVTHLSSGKGLLLEPPFTIECEGPAPPEPHIAHAKPLADKPSITWVAHSIHTYTDCVDCSEYGWTHMGVIEVTRYVSLGIDPGRYEVTFGVLDQIPDHCSEDSQTGELSCWMDGPAYSETGGLCQMPRLVTVEFDLPASGEIMVQVPVPPPAP
jgi:hypothetical protein